MSEVNFGVTYISRVIPRLPALGAARVLSLSNDVWPLRSLHQDKKLCIWAHLLLRGRERLIWSGRHTDCEPLWENGSAWNAAQPKARKQSVVLDAEHVLMRARCRKEKKRGGCLLSLDEIAGGLYVDKPKINWIPIIFTICTAANFTRDFLKANKSHMLHKLSTVTLITPSLGARGSTPSQNLL
ncbi:unnamed protein product [Pleuronectes platessa]|uniref:Uncharacterized protein n=1 Tax=Pleuronectes platessa TaxID=8262 RepID=A0A9N7VG92_PLEPL|nr:unnamed protein product [Pleuronectes platessa]